MTIMDSRAMKTKLNTTMVKPTLSETKKFGSLQQVGVGDDAIRAKLFQKLGIQSPLLSPLQSVMMTAQNIKNMNRGNHGDQNFVHPHLLEPLKAFVPHGQGQQDDRDTCSLSFNTTTSNSRQKSSTCHDFHDNQTTMAIRSGKPLLLTSTPSTTTKSKGVRFTDTTQVWLIPRRQDYSRRLRKLMWYERHEQLWNVRRNTIEFWYEGWNWQHVLEEPSMYINMASGERIHPVHFQYSWKPEYRYPPHQPIPPMAVLPMAQDSQHHITMNRNVTTMMPSTVGGS